MWRTNSSGQCTVRARTWVRRDCGRCRSQSRLARDGEDPIVAWGGTTPSASATCRHRTPASLRLRRAIGTSLGLKADGSSSGGATTPTVSAMHRFRIPISWRLRRVGVTVWRCILAARSWRGATTRSASARVPVTEHGVRGRLRAEISTVSASRSDRLGRRLEDSQRLGRVPRAAAEYGLPRARGRLQPQPPGPRWRPSGDLNCDGVISFADINPLCLYLSDYAAWASGVPRLRPAATAT